MRHLHSSHHRADDAWFIYRINQWHRISSGENLTDGLQRADPVILGRQYEHRRPTEQITSSLRVKTIKFNSYSGDKQASGTVLNSVTFVSLFELQRFFSCVHDRQIKNLKPIIQIPPDGPAPP